MNRQWTLFYRAILRTQQKASWTSEFFSWCIENSYYRRRTCLNLFCWSFQFKKNFRIFAKIAEVRAQPSTFPAMANRYYEYLQLRLLNFFELWYFAADPQIYFLYFAVRRPEVTWHEITSRRRNLADTASLLVYIPSHNFSLIIWTFQFQCGHTKNAGAIDPSSWKVQRKPSISTYYRWTTGIAKSPSHRPFHKSFEMIFIYSSITFFVALIHKLKSNDHRGKL